MAPTARQYQLEVSHYIDERRDPIRATSAALDYLEELYERFGSWYLAAASFNTGENRVGRLLNRHDVRVGPTFAPIMPGGASFRAHFHLTVACTFPTPSITIE